MSAENLGQVPAPQGSLSTFSNSKASLYGEEIVRFPFRLNIPILPNPDPNTDFTAFVLPIDASLQSAFFNAFEYYTFENLTLDLQCTAPLGTASGAVQVGYFSDPLNAGVPSGLAAAKSKIGSTDGWVMIRPRDSKALNIPVDVNPMLPGWRYVRTDDANIRMSSFGTVVGITAEPPAAGDGTVYEGWLHGWAVGKRRTEQTSSLAAYMRFHVTWKLYSFEWDYVINCPVLQFSGNTQLGAGDHKHVSFLFDNIISTSLKIAGTGPGDVELTAVVFFDFSAIQGALIEGGNPLIKFALPQLVELGFTADKLEVLDYAENMITALDNTSAIMMYRPASVQSNPASFNQARFASRSEVNISVKDTTKRDTACVISGRVLPAATARTHSVFAL